ncbi:hypothetical protein [Shimazuella kribbensis]|uniref:hypothetical protein n=1 Tax=Shimazuella kribbensis TaxID=139808 RepID=UPI0004048637|nr:hypothetical protein [Shimazuella kribbensis]
MGKQILFTLIRKSVVLGLALVVGLLIGFTVSLMMAKTTIIVGFSATAMVVIALSILMAITSLIGDGVLARVGAAKPWINLVFIAGPSLLFVYYYFLNGGIFLELPGFQLFSQAVLYGSIAFSLIFWGLDELSVKFLKRRKASKNLEPDGVQY